MMQLLYRGSRDGDSTQTCHELCDNKQNVLIVMKSDTNYVFGILLLITKKLFVI